MHRLRINQAELVEWNGDTQKFWENENLSSQLRTLVSQTRKTTLADKGRYSSQISNNLSSPYLAKAPWELNPFDQAQWYCDNYPNFGLFEQMKTMNHHDFIAFIHQKSYTKAYFIKFLQVIEKWAKDNDKTELLRMIQRNLQDETGIYYWFPVPWFEKVEIEVWETIADKIPNNDDTYKLQAHSTMRVDMSQGYNDAYFEIITLNQEQYYRYSNKTMPKEKRNNGTGLFNAWVDRAMKHWHWLEILGAMIFLEMSIPVEFINMTQARDRLFPDMSAKSKIYEDFHIEHDLDWHTKWLIAWYDDAQFNDEEIKLIKNWMHNMMLLRWIFYQGFVEQLSSNG